MDVYQHYIEAFMLPAPVSSCSREQRNSHRGQFKTNTRINLLEELQILRIREKVRCVLLLLAEALSLVVHCLGTVEHADGPAVQKAKSSAGVTLIIAYIEQCNVHLRAHDDSRLRTDFSVPVWQNMLSPSKPRHEETLRRAAEDGRPSKEEPNYEDDQAPNDAKQSSR